MQAEFLRSLNGQGQCEAVVSHFEAGRVVSNEQTLGEYVKALARLDRLDGSRVMALMQVCGGRGTAMRLVHGGAMRGWTSCVGYQGSAR